MQRHGEEVDVSTTEARAGSTPHIVRWVLIISLVLVVVGMSAIWIFGALTTEDRVSDGTTPEQAVMAPGATEPNVPSDSPDAAMPPYVGEEVDEVETVTTE